MERFRPADLMGWIVVPAVPFVSWGTVPWLTGVFSLLLLLAVLLEVRDAGKGTGGMEIGYTTLWMPAGAALLLGGVHLALSPVPYSSLLFLAHVWFAWVFYLLVLRVRPFDPLVPVTFWTAGLLLWVLSDLLLKGVRPPSGPFQNPNYLATVLLTCLAWYLGRLMDLKGERGQEPKRALFLIAALATTAALAVIGSRSAGLAILGLWCLSGILGRGRMRLAAAGVVLILLVAPSTLKHRVTEGYRGDPHAFSRIQIWEGALRMGLDNPVLGVGPNLYYEHAPVYAFPAEELPVRYGRIARKPHNEYLRAWAEGGVAGAAIAAALLFLVARLCMVSWKAARAGPALAVAVLAFQALFHDLGEVFALTALAAFWLAALSVEGVTVIKVRGPGRKALLALALAATSLLALWLNLDSSARVQWARGQRSLAAGSADGIDLLERASTLSPLLPGAARDLAAARLAAYRAGSAAGDGKGVERAIRKAHRLNLMDTVPLRIEADLFLERASGAPGGGSTLVLQAVERLDLALELEPNNALIMFSRAGALARLGQWEAALSSLDLALETEPNFLDAHRARISLLEEHRPGEVKGAVRDLTAAVERLDGYQPLSAYEKVIAR